jgi:hypothetical protein
VTLDHIASWALLGAAILAVALIVAGIVKLAFAARGLAQRAQALALPSFDLDRASVAMARLEADLAAATALLDRASAALAQIEGSLQELADSPPVKALRVLLRVRVRA